MNIVKNRYVQSRTLESKNKQLTLCTDCGDIHYKGFWYASDSQFAMQIDEKTDRISYRCCPACTMERKGSYAGVLHIKSIPPELVGSVFAVIKRAAEQDSTENPQHRILDFAVVTNGYKLTATSARMIRRIGRNILDAYESCEAQSTYKKEPRPLQITDIAFAIPGYFNQGIRK